MTRIALVTGASRGLGRSAARHIAQRGSDLILTYQNRVEDAAAVVEEIEAMGRKALAFQLDTGDVAAFAPFAETLRRTWQRDTFDHLVNNAGHGDHALIADTTEALFDRLVDVHFKGVYLSAR